MGCVLLALWVPLLPKVQEAPLSTLQARGLSWTGHQAGRGREQASGVAQGRLRSADSWSETGAREFMPQALIRHLLCAGHRSWCREMRHSPSAAGFRGRQRMAGADVYHPKA